ncbi:Uncharacterised protein [Achromobacter sp. 2789STDY5608621]|nr:Uncharacterised protein [Achromobacter sp. 2789STDY5608621]
MGMRLSCGSGSRMVGLLVGNRPVLFTRGRQIRTDQSGAVRGRELRRGVAVARVARGMGIAALSGALAHRLDTCAKARIPVRGHRAGLRLRTFGRRWRQARVSSLVSIEPQSLLLVGDIRGPRQMGIELRVPERTTRALNGGSHLRRLLLGRKMGGQPQTDMIVFPQTQPDPKGTSHERKIQSRERQVANHHASPRARCVSDRPSRYPSRTHSVTRDRSDFPVSSAAARETRLDGTSTKSGGAGDSDTSICPCTRPATLRDSRRRALTGGLSVPSSSNARSRSLTSCPEISPAARSRSWLASGGGGMALPSRMARLLLGWSGGGQLGRGRR